jgi:uncharacterized surface protein with fasciclin (FAS1) repeats
MLLKPENKPTLVKVLTYHVVPGACDSIKLRGLIIAGNGKATLKTAQGETLTFTINGSSNLAVTDAKGDVADTTITDVLQSNGVIHVIDKVLMPAT